MSNPNRLSGVQLDLEFAVPEDAEGDIWDQAWTEHCIRRLRPDDKDVFMSMLGLSGSETKPDPMKRCPMCKESKSKKEFYRSGSRSDGLSTYCKPCSVIASTQVRKRRQKRETP